MSAKLTKTFTMVQSFLSFCLCCDTSVLDHFLDATLKQRFPELFPGNESKQSEAKPGLGSRISAADPDDFGVDHGLLTVGIFPKKPSFFAFLHVGSSTDEGALGACVRNFPKERDVLAFTPTSLARGDSFVPSSLTHVRHHLLSPMVSLVKVIGGETLTAARETSNFRPAR